MIAERPSGLFERVRTRTDGCVMQEQPDYEMHNTLAHMVINR